MDSLVDEQREFLRVDHESPVKYKEVRSNKLLQKNEVTTRNVSASGLLFRTHSIPPAISTTVWIEMDPKMMNICSEIEHDLVRRENGVYGRVVRIAEGEPGVSYDVGVCFLRKNNLDERDLAEILPDN